MNIEYRSGGETLGGAADDVEFVASFHAKLKSMIETEYPDATVSTSRKSDFCNASQIIVTDTDDETDDEGVKETVHRLANLAWESMS